MEIQKQETTNEVENASPDTQSTAKLEISRYRTLSPFFRSCSIGLTIIGIVVSIIYLFHIASDIWGGLVTGTVYYHLVLAMFLPQCFLYFTASGKETHKLPWYDALFNFSWDNIHFKRTKILPEAYKNIFDSCFGRLLFIGGNNEYCQDAL
jgi:hypothetical protein